MIIQIKEGVLICMNIDFQQLKQSLTEEQIITIVEDLGGYYKENST